MKVLVLSPLESRAKHPKAEYILPASGEFSLQIFIELSPTVTKLCHIKCDHPACISVDGGHFEHIIVVVLNMA